MLRSEHVWPHRHEVEAREDVLRSLKANLRPLPAPVPVPRGVSIRTMERIQCFERALDHATYGEGGAPVRSFLQVAPESQIIPFEKIRARKRSSEMDAQSVHNILPGNP